MKRGMQLREAARYHRKHNSSNMFIYRSQKGIFMQPNPIKRNRCNDRNRPDLTFSRHVSYRSYVNRVESTKDRLHLRSTDSTTLEIRTLNILNHRECQYTQTPCGGTTAHKGVGVRGLAKERKKERDILSEIRVHQIRYSPKLC